MILVISTSSPWASAALLKDGVVLASAREHAPRSASSAILGMLDGLLAEAGIVFSDIELFAADAGPGSFTGVKVGVTLGKTWAYAQGCQVTSVSAFDLISQGQPAAIPIRRGVLFGRKPGGEVEPIVSAAGYVGYAEDCDEQVFPDASRAPGLALVPMSAFELTPDYHLAPSISQAKKPLIMGGSGA